MDTWTFGMTLTVVGMGGTLVTLWIISLIMNLLKRLFPLAREERAAEHGEGQGALK